MTVLKRPATWEETKKQLGDANFMMKLLQFDKDTLDDALLKKINKFTANTEFTPDSVGKVGWVWIASGCWRRHEGGLVLGALVAMAGLSLAAFVDCPRGLYFPPFFLAE